MLQFYFSSGKEKFSHVFRDGWCHKSSCSLCCFSPVEAAFCQFSSISSTSLLVIALDHHEPLESPKIVLGESKDKSFTSSDLSVAKEFMLLFELVRFSSVHPVHNRSCSALAGSFHRHVENSAYPLTPNGYLSGESLPASWLVTLKSARSHNQGRFVFNIIVTTNQTSGLIQNAGI